jgi:hypothetical protein
MAVNGSKKKFGDLPVKEPDVTGANLILPIRAIASWQTKGGLGISMPFNDPLQGCVNNCYFMAALSSVAWSASGMLRTYPNYSFYNLDAGQWEPTESQKTTWPAITENLPLDANGNLIYARSLSTNTWPMLYEKAYVKWKDGPNHPDHADYSKVDGGANGFIALKEITGWGNPADAYDTTRTEAQIIADIPWYYILADRAKAKYPTVAWTKANINNPPAGIYPAHTYSLLGRYSSGGIFYVVLRNPYGAQVAEPTLDVIRPNTNFYGINLSLPGDGVFALKMDKFRSYFAKYAYVKP